MPDFHALGTEEALSEVGGRSGGLSESEAARRLEKSGPNELAAGKGTTKLQILAEQLRDFLILLLIAAAVISMGIGLSEGSMEEIIEAGLILVIVVFIVIIGFYQQYHAERELEALKSMMTPRARVLRGGKVREVPASELVSGDVVVVEAGDRIPADLRILESNDLRCDESSLTGESTPVEKSTKALKSDTALADRTDMLYMATNAVYGRGKAVVVATGMKTQLGRIAENLAEIKKEKTPLQERLNKLGKQIGVVVLLVAGIILVVGMLSGGTPFQEMFIIAVALAVAAVPEGLPGVVTVALATGIRRMVSHNAIIRRLPAVETLGSTTIICSDKTGTLTKNEMTVRRVWTPDGFYEVEGDGYGKEGGFRKDGKAAEPEGDLEELFTAGALVCDATVDEESNITGDPTEAAVVVVSAKGGREGPEDRYSLVDEIPFSSERKRKTKIYKNGEGGERVAYSMGAPDVLIDCCSKLLSKGRRRKLNKKLRDRVLSKNEELAAQAFRVLALAKKEGASPKDAEEGMTFLGLVAMIDPPRQESRDAVDECKSAGVRVVMITGDHKLTAKAIAKELGIYGEGDRVMTGPEIEKAGEGEMKKLVDEVSVYARVSPLHKLKIVEALQAKGNVVAVTGDGVNDAPALKKADIGVAMGITGTDVSKEASDMVLTDDNFSSIVRAVEEGRGIYDNIRKFFAYLISGNIGEVGIVFLSFLIPGAPYALTASQILIINLVTDGLPALALGVDPFEPGAMERTPRSKSEPIYGGLRPFVVWYPLLMIIVTMGLFMWVWGATQNEFQAQTVAFLSVAFFEMYQAFASRSTRYPSFKVGIAKNKYLIAAVGFSLAIVLLLLYAPVGVPGTSISLGELTHITPVEPGLLVLIAVLSSVGFIYLELAKWRNAGKKGKERN